MYRTVSYIAIDPKGTHSLMADDFFDEYPTIAEKYDACLFAGIAFDLCSGADFRDVADAASVEPDTVWLFREWLSVSPLSAIHNIAERSSSVPACETDGAN